MMDAAPWKIITHLFPDLVLVVEGRKLYYHQAVLVQHSALVKSLLLKSSCCKCGGRECSRNSGNIFITLEGLQVDTVQYVMDILYAGGGSIAGDSHDYAKVVEMLQIQTVMIDKVEAKDGFTKDEFNLAAAREEKENAKKVMSQEKIDDRGKERDVDRGKVEVLEVGSAPKKKDETKAPPVKRGGKRNLRANSSNKEDVKEVEIEEKSKTEPEPKKKPEIEVREEKNPSTSNKLAQLVEKYAGKKVDGAKTLSKDNFSGVKAATNQSGKTADLKAAKENIEIVIDDDDNDGKVEKIESSNNDNEKYYCPFKDCKSESKTSQSIKVHLALVHYKKTIQTDFPNWKRQKCDQCDKSFGQMTAYYLHMANHKRYPFMDLPGDALRVQRDGENSKYNGGGTSGGILTPSRTQTPILSTGMVNLPPPGPPSGPIHSGGSRNMTQTSPANSSGTIFGRSNSFVQSRPGNMSSGDSLMRSKSFVQQSQSSSFSSNPRNAAPSASSSRISNSRTSLEGTSSPAFSRISGGPSFNSPMPNQRVQNPLKASPLGGSQAQNTFNRPAPPGPSGSLDGPPGPKSVNMKKGTNNKRSSSPVVKEGKKFRGL